MKTPIQELIEVLKKEAQYISDNDHIEDRTYRRGLREAIQNAESMLEKEEEFMKSVWLDGRNSRTNGKDIMEQINNL